MAGSYNHCVNDDGSLRSNETLGNMLENGGDVFEAVEELFGMIWFLAAGDAVRVEEARRGWRQGLALSPRSPESSAKLAGHYCGGRDKA